MEPGFRLRLSHDGAAALRVEHAGGTLRFDPLVAPEEGEICVLTWNETERLQGVLEAVKAGRRPIVMAQESILAWLGGFGEVEGREPTGENGGLTIGSAGYTPVPYATPAEGLRKLKSALTNPVRAVSRLRKRAQLPDCEPSIFQLQLPTGERLLHLNCSLHRWTDSAWLEEQAERFGKADWTIVGVDYEECDAVCELIGYFSPQTLLVTDLVNDVRTRLGLPIELITPTVDRLREDGFNAHVFSTESSFRFE